MQEMIWMEFCLLSQEEVEQERRRRSPCLKKSDGLWKYLLEFSERCERRSEYIGTRIE